MDSRCPGESCPTCDRVVCTCPPPSDMATECERLEHNRRMAQLELAAKILRSHAEERDFERLLAGELMRAEPHPDAGDFIEKHFQRAMRKS